MKNKKDIKMLRLADIGREEKLKELVIYGASGGGKKVYNTLKSFGIDVNFFVDSNSNIWGECVDGKKIYCPEYLIGKECNIVIASEAGYTDIKNYLMKLGINGKILLRENIIFPLIKQWNIESKDNSIIKNKKSVFLELLEGYKLGGVENWSYNLAMGLHKAGYDVKILSSKVESTPDEWKEVLLEGFDGDYIEYKHCIVELLKYLEKRLPCVLILNKQQQLFYAGYLLKKMYPDKVEIYSVIHSDLEAIYLRQKYFEQYIERYICISKNIYKKMKYDYRVDINKLIYKENPVISEDGIVRSYSENIDEPVKLAYGGRLEFIQKRADLIITLIEKLEEKKVNYIFNIAGEGEYFEIISKYINDHGLENKVKMYGNIRHELMTKFWKDADIFINVSESEGLPTSMLEAMLCGCVPIVFDTSGSTDFISDNGYVVEVANCDKMAERVKYLSENRKVIKKMGILSADIVKDRCDYNKYIKFWKNMILKV